MDHTGSKIQYKKLDIQGYFWVNFQLCLFATGGFWSSYRKVNERFAQARVLIRVVTSCSISDSF